MSGHSKWHNIKHKKDITDAKRGKVFTKHAKIIAIAARSGGADSSTNSALRTAIENAKADNVPNSNIEKAVKKGSGDDKEGMNFMEIMYEGFGPSGIALYISAITDNRNRTVANLKTIIGKGGGNLSEAGTTGWMFQRKGIILAKTTGDLQEAELNIIDSGAEDFTRQDNEFEIVTEPSSLMKVRDNLEKAGLKIEKVEITYLPKNVVKIEDLEAAQKILKLMDAIEEDEDVSNVYSNFEISEEIMKKL